MNSSVIKYKSNAQAGFSLPELVVVLLILSILCVVALPQVLSARRLFGFSGMQKQIVATISEARQHAMSERRPVTVRYQDSTKTIIVYGGKFGAFGTAGNQVTILYGSGINQSEIIYGRPPAVTAAALGDGTNLTGLGGGIVEITFQADGAVVDAGNNPVNTALFLYSSGFADKSPFAVSVLGAGGRVKLWRYNQSVNKYVE